MKNFTPEETHFTQRSKSPFRNLELFFLAVFCLLSSSFCFSQPYWNEWINFSQKYYKIPVAQNGIYRLDSLTLSSAGVPLSSFDPRNIQLFFRGQEQYIYIAGESDGVLNSSDYIEFYGQKNDGSLDSILYKGDLYDKPVHQPNPYYSLFNDTSAYFLTWNNFTVNKRIILSPDTSFSSFPDTANYFMKEVIIENHTEYYYGRSTSTNISFPEFHEVEGWSGIAFGHSGGNIPTLYTATFNTSNLYSSGQNVQVKLAVMGASDATNSAADHDLQITYKDVSGSYVFMDRTVFDGYRLFDSSYVLPASAFGASTDIVVSAQTGNFSTSRNTVPYIVMKFPHTPNLENKSYYEMYVPDNASQSKSFYTFTNFNGSNTNNGYVYDLTNHLRIPMTKSGNDYKVLIPNAISSTEKFCIVKSENQFLQVTSIKPVRGTGFFTNYSTLGADSAFIIITHKSLRGTPGADEYADYRANTLPGGGGGHNVLVADIDELYDQFGYGIPKHPFSIRHFAEYCLDSFPTPPQNLFLIGKSVQTNLGRNQYADPTGEIYTNSLVPSIAYPTCDNMLVAVLNGNLIAPAIPIGRLAAKNISDITTYLKKVKEYEHPYPNPDEWMKHVIHMGGGGNEAQQTQFSNYLHGYENTIENVCMGAFVHHFSKNSSAPTQISYTDSIRGLINKGVSLLTFFGHSSSTVFEFNILLPDEYDNKDGKYPFFTAAGCTAGDIHQPVAAGISSSEQYVLSDKGMIGFLASSGPGTAWELNQYLSNLYKDIGYDLYGQSIGKCIQATIKSVEGDGTSIYMNAACLEMTLHSDPSIVIHANKLPDYAINNSSVFFNPSYVSTDLDSFDINIIITNIGSACKNDSVQVEIKRTFIDGTSITHFDTIPPVYFKDTLTVRLPVDPIKGPGLNKFEVRVDYPNDVPELEDVLNNNILAPYEVPLLIYSGDIIPVYPYKYAIVPSDTIMLKAYTANPFASRARYIFEVDTTDLFNSPQKRIQRVTQAGAVVNAPYDAWLNLSSPSPLILTDSTVYFWHVRRDTSDTLNFRWRESSFQYIPDKRGWGQSHFFQFLKGDKFSYIDTNRVPRYFDLDFQNRSLRVTTLTYHAFTPPTLCYNFYIDGIKAYGLSCSIMSLTPPYSSHVIIIIMDPVTGVPWYNTGGMYGSYYPANYQFEFPTSTPSQQETLRQFLQNTIPCGHKVILCTDNYHNLGDILGGNGPNTNLGLVQAFQSIGSTQFPNIQNDLPYTPTKSFSYRKIRTNQFGKKPIC